MRARHNRHTFESWLMMRGASLRSVAELLWPADASNEPDNSGDT
jgi:site-specific recombinase XerD